MAENQVLEVQIRRYMVEGGTVEIKFCKLVLIYYSLFKAAFAACKTFIIRVIYYKGKLMVLNNRIK